MHSAKHFQVPHWQLPRIRWQKNQIIVQAVKIRQVTCHLQNLQPVHLVQPDTTKQNLRSIPFLLSLCQLSPISSRIHATFFTTQLTAGASRKFSVNSRYIRQACIKRIRFGHFMRCCIIIFHSWEW